MSDMERISISLPSKLLEEFDKIIDEKGYASRSEAIRDALREYIIKYKWLKSLEGERVGTLSVIYNHHAPEILEKLTDLQHKYKDVIMANLHIHLDEDNCLEIIIISGDAKKIIELKNNISTIKGVKLAKLSVVAPKDKIPE